MVGRRVRGTSRARRRSGQSGASARVSPAVERTRRQTALRACSRQHHSAFELAATSPRAIAAWRESRLHVRGRDRGVIRRFGQAAWSGGAIRRRGSHGQRRGGRAAAGIQFELAGAHSVAITVRATGRMEAMISLSPALRSWSGESTRWITDSRCALTSHLLAARSRKSLATGTGANVDDIASCAASHT